MRILVVDDNAELRDLVARALARDGHRVETAHDLASADASLADRETELVVLDLALPDGWGSAWCQRLRAAGDGPMVLVLSAHHEVARRLESFDAGADDFLAKPFAVAELRARVRALGRRRSGARTPVLRSGDVALDFGARRATRGGAPCALTAREWSVLERLAAEQGRVVARAALLEEVWGDADEAQAASLDVIMVRIRKKLGGALVRTVRGGGYVIE